MRVQVRFRRPGLPHFGQGAFLGAEWTGITTGVGASVPMVCISGGEDGRYPHSPGCRPYLSRAKRLRPPCSSGGDQRGVSIFGWSTETSSPPRVGELLAHLGWGVFEPTSGGS